MEQVARIAGEWFVHHLERARKEEEGSAFKTPEVFR